MYEHVDAHQDDQRSYQQLSREAQLNSCIDNDAKREWWGEVELEAPQQQALPLDPSW